MTSPMRRLLVFLAIAILTASCAIKPATPPPTTLPVAPPAKVIEQKALESYVELQNLSMTMPQEQYLPRLEEGLKNIMQQYPETYLAEESYYHLINKYLNTFDPPRIEDAEDMYVQYFKAYEKPKLGPAINRIVADFYYTYGHWERLAAFCVPFVKSFLESVGTDDTLYVLYYADAKFNLKDYEEARRGYVYLINRARDQWTIDISNKRLRDIEAALLK